MDSSTAGSFGFSTKRVIRFSGLTCMIPSAEASRAATGMVATVKSAEFSM